MLSEFLPPTNPYSTKPKVGPKMMNPNIAPGDAGGGIGGGGWDAPPSAVPAAPAAPAAPDAQPVYPTLDLNPYSGGGGGGYNGYGAGGPAYTPGAAPTFDFNGTLDVPTFTAPQFTPPSAQSLLENDPGYQARLKAGQDALQSSAAARGSLLTGGTLSDLIRYGQDYGSQEYGNAYNRALQGFQQNYRGSLDQYTAARNEALDEYNAQYQAALAQFQPQYQAWATTAGIDSQQALQAQQLGYQNWWNQQQQDYNSWLAWQQLQLQQSGQLNDATALSLIQ